ncbi:MAG: TIR domain-containing protein [Anaerolineales bacterium]|nr:TIR domain-containing protein [Anaerolineales bacterium]
MDMADEYKYDVFISYSHKDEDWVVNTLSPVLENAGLKVCVDFRDFEAGVPSLVNMENAVDESRQTVLVLTPNWVDSEWTDFEAILTQTDDPVGRRKKMIPLMLAECTPPKRIKTITYVNFMRTVRLNIAWKQLFTALGKPDAHIPSTSSPTKPEIEIPSDWHLAHPYPMPPNFTGREAERKMLVDWLQNDTENRLFILCALGGFGKSALAWHWLTHDVSVKDWPKVIWWSFYEGDASFEHFIEETLKYLNLEVPPGQRQQVDALLKAMSAQNILLIMDGFERALRAYSSMNAAYQEDSELSSPLGGGVGGEVQTNQRDCVNLNAEIFLKNLCVLPNIKGKVLITTRLPPRAVEQRGELLGGCYEEELKALQKEDAVAFFRAQGIRGARAEIVAACAPHGYHPLSLRILAGLIANDRDAPGDIAVVGKLDITDDVIQNKQHVLEVAYNTLLPEQQKLLGYIACFRSAMSYNALKAISERDIDAGLKTLEHRGLLHWDKSTNKYDLHPIVRRYAYERLTTPDRTSAHERLVGHFEAVPKPEKVEKLEDLAPVIELYHHMVGAGNLDEALKLFYDRIIDPIFYQFGAYQLQIELLRALFLDGEDKPPRLKRDDYQAFAFSELANAYSKSGQPRRAVPLFEMQNVLQEKAGNKKNLAIGLGNVAGMAQIYIGALSAAERNLRYKIEMEVDEFDIAVGHQDLGRVLSYRGAWQEAEQELDTGLILFEKQHAVQSEGIIWSYHALRFQLMARANSQSSIVNLKSSIECAQRALELANEQAKNYPVPRDYVRAHWLLGAAYRMNNELTLAEENLSKAIIMCRQINMVDHEADILLDIAKLRYAQEKPDEAKTLAEEALLITERCGYVLQGADVHLFLAQLALAESREQGVENRDAKEKARKYARRALELATCDGPPYYYKVAYEEAERMLEKLKK